MPVPDSKGSDITKRIEKLSKRSDISPFEVKSLQKEIDRLMTVDAAEAYMLGGMLAAMTGDLDNSKALHEKSLRLECDVVGLFNFGVSMKKVSNFTLALELFAKAAELSPGEFEIATHRLQTMSFLLDFTGFSCVFDELVKTHPGKNVQEMPAVLNAQGIMESLNALDISIDEYSKFGRHVEKSLLERGLSAFEVTQHISSFDGVSHMYAEYHVDVTSAELLVEVNELLMENIISDESLEGWDKVVINIVRRDQDSHRDHVEHSAA